MYSIIFFFNDTATTEIYTLSLHDALPISIFDYMCVSASLEDRVVEYVDHLHEHFVDPVVVRDGRYLVPTAPDRKSTRLNSSHLVISYAVFCLKKKKHTTHPPHYFNTDTTQ